MKKRLQRITMISLGVSMAVVACNLCICAESRIDAANYREVYLKFAEESDGVQNSLLSMTSGMIMADFDMNGVPELLTFSTVERRYDENGNIVQFGQEGYESAYISREYCIERGFYIKDGMIVENSPWGNNLKMSYLPEDLPEDTELCTMMVKLILNGENALFMSYSGDMTGYVENLIIFNEDTGFEFDYAHNKVYNEFYYDNYFIKNANVSNAVNVTYRDLLKNRTRTKREAMERLLDKYEASKNEYTFGFVNNDIKVTLNGNNILFDQPPIIVNDRTLVPFRTIFEAFGATVDWDGETQMITANKAGVRISFVVGSNQMYVDDREITFDVPSQIVNERTLVPIRAISESLGCSVEWDSDTQKVIITK